MTEFERERERNAAALNYIAGRDPAASVAVVCRRSKFILKPLDGVRPSKTLVLEPEVQLRPFRFFGFIGLAYESAVSTTDIRLGVFKEHPGRC